MPVAADTTPSMLHWVSYHHLELASSVLVDILLLARPCMLHVKLVLKPVSCTPNVIPFAAAQSMQGCDLTLC